MTNQSYFDARRLELYRMYVHAWNTVPYYGLATGYTKPPAPNHFTYRFFSALPILEKAQVRAEGARMVSSQHQLEDLLVDVTSGTEGRPLQCYKTPRDRIAAAHRLWARRRHWVQDLSPRDRFARFYTYRRMGEGLETTSVLYRGNDMHIPLNDMSESRLQEYWDAITDFGPRWMHGPSTAVFNLACYAHKRQWLRPTSLEFIELNGEFVPPEQLAYIRRVFRCKVADHYGSREFWTLAYSCADDELHILDRRVFIESVERAETGGSELVVTSLTNLAWPLIRYRLGDLGEVVPPDATCAQPDSYRLRIRRGRRADYFTLGNGRVFNAIVFSGIARAMSQDPRTPAIYQYQVRKVSETRLTVRLCLGSRDSIQVATVLKGYDAELRKVVGSDVHLDYEVVDTIVPDPRTGKVKDFVDLSTSTPAMER